MWYEDLFSELDKLKDTEQAEKMSAYMKNRFPFLGIPKPKLTAFIKPYFKISKQFSLDWNFIKLCWETEYREAQYIAVEYLKLNSNNLTEQDLPKLRELIITKSWWDTTDSIDALVGAMLLKQPSLQNEMLVWSCDENIWVRRVAIDFQLQYKEKTNTVLLEEILINNFGGAEFFINKAIGWSLREYSKTDQDFVRLFLLKHSGEMDKLSVKEASVYLNGNQPVKKPGKDSK